MNMEMMTKSEEAFYPRTTQQDDMP